MISKRFRCLVLISLLAASLAHAAEPASAPRPRPAPERYAKTIAGFGRQEPEKHGIVFIGSSATTRWKSLPEDFPDLPVLNRAFGGSRINDLIFHFDAIVLRHEPKMVVIDIGGNDINAGLTVEETFTEYLQLLEIIHGRLPKARVIINSLGISVKRAAHIPRVLEMNGRLAAWTQDKDWTRFVDRTPYQLGASGQPSHEYYVDDLLHPSRAGYLEWIKVFGPVLREEWAKVRPNPQRFAKQIAAFASQEPEKGGIVFAGSSSIVLWKSLKDDFPDLPVLNRGFGGSVVNDLIVHLDTVVLRHEPRLLVLFTGGNDINRKLTVRETFGDYTRLLNLVHERLPRTRVIVNSVKISIKRVTQIPQIHELNRLLEAWTKDKDWIRFLDSTSYLADATGQPIRDYYVDDLVHFSPTAYAEWLNILDPVLREEWAKAGGMPTPSSGEEHLNGFHIAQPRSDGSG
jgi:lysophospholipase L1-like esterase